MIAAKLAGFPCPDLSELLGEVFGVAMEGLLDDLDLSGVVSSEDISALASEAVDTLMNAATAFDDTVTANPTPESVVIDGNGKMKDDKIRIRQLPREVLLLLSSKFQILVCRF